MAFVKVADSNGDSIKLGLDNGRYMPSEFRSIESLSSFTARADDVILCSYSRSGTHWLWELIMMTMKGDHEYQKRSKTDTMLELVGCDYLDKEPAPRVINTHLNYPDLPKDILRKKAKIVLLQRNPKDVALSYYHFLSQLTDFEYSGKFDGFLSLFQDGKLPYGSWFQYTSEWNDVIKSGSSSPILVVYYEELKKNFQATMSKIGTFLNVNRPDEFYDSMEKKTGVDTFKRALNENLTEAALAMWKSDPGFVRKGVTGDWKNWFTVAQNEHFDSIVEEKLNGSIFNFDYS